MSLVSSSATAAAHAALPPLIDIAVNLTDCVFVGVDWKGKQVHPSDFTHMMARAKSANVQKCLISGTSLVQCARAIRLCKTYPGTLFCTIGVHPANSSEFLVPISDGERDYVERFIDEEKRPSKTQKSKIYVERKEQEWNSNMPQTSHTSALNPTNAILDYTIGTPLKFDAIPEPYLSEWHTNKSSHFENERLQYLRLLVECNKDVVAAVGECGLDGAELEYCPFEVQQRYFIKQLEMAAELELPLFLHSRDCGMRFAEVLRPFWSSNPMGHGNDNCEQADDKNSRHPSKRSGVVHSFTGSEAELTELLQMGLHIGLNASAFRTEESAKKSVTQIPLDRLLLETDAPWCDIRRDNFGFQFIKSHYPTIKKEKLKADHLKAEGFEVPCIERRNEPCHLSNVLECFVGCRNLFVSSEEVTIPSITKHLYENTVRLFPLLERQ